MANLETEIARRRSFAIISHPDAGKTTLTEKLLLMGGAINQAGAVKARGEQRRARSDWMKVEQERGISVTSAAMTFEFEDVIFNLLDTPGHGDFSEDTYRTLTAVDSAVMVIDAAKGIEAQTLKLFEVCRLRDMPITTFVNKMDREARDPFEIIDEIEQTLAIDVTPASWPIGMGAHFKGCYDLLNDRLILMDRAREKLTGEVITCEGLNDPKIDELIDENLAAQLREEVEMVQELCPAFDRQAYLEGTMTPIYFGSAINTFGVRELIEGLHENAPRPLGRPTLEGAVTPEDTTVSGFVFKVQANMDPKHRDRVAFFRMCSGHFKRGMKLKHVRDGKDMAISNPVLFMAETRDRAEEAYPGDIIGIPNHGNLRIGDTLTSGKPINFTGIPSFAPEHIQTARVTDPMKGKHLEKALRQFAEEGAAHVFKPHIGTAWVVGVVGPLQFDVLAARMDAEYDVPVRFEATSLHTARWVDGPDHKAVQAFVDGNKGNMADDHTGAPVFIARNQWELDKAAEDWPDITLKATREQFD